MTSAMTDYIHVSDSGEVSFIPGEMTDNRTTELLPCPICGKKVYIGLYGDGRDYWWMVHGGMHYDECKCRLFMESCKFELEDEAKVDYDERAMSIRGGLVRRWNTRAERTCEQVLSDCDDGLMPPFTAHCSACGAEWGFTPKFCPNCGRKVVGA